MAAIAPNLEFVPGVIILPQRQTALVAKQAAEVDILTEGKFRLGIGVGWNEVEYEGLNEDFATRGKRVEEQVALLRRLWTEPIITFKGDYHTVTEAGETLCRFSGRFRSGSVVRPMSSWSGPGGSPMVGSRWAAATMNNSARSKNFAGMPRRLANSRCGGNRCPRRHEFCARIGVGSGDRPVARGGCDPYLHQHHANGILDR